MTISCKKQIVLAFLLVGIQLSYGQEVKKSFNGSGKKLIKIFIDDTELKVVGVNSSEVKIKAEDYTPPPERAKGLKPLFRKGEDNTGIGLDIQQSNNQMTIRKVSSEDASYYLEVPADVDVVIEENNWEGEIFHLENIKGEIEINSLGSDIVAKGVEGPLVLSSTSGDIEVVFAKVHQAKPSSITATSGYIDVTMPAETKANMKLSAISGEVYTDLDIKISDLDKKEPFMTESRFKGTLNGGGVEISINAISSDVYLRKK